METLLYFNDLLLAYFAGFLTPIGVGVFLLMNAK